MAKQPPKQPLTQRQKKVLKIISDYWKKHGHGPSTQDVADGLGVGPSGVDYHIIALIRKGHATRTPGVARSLKAI